MAGEIGVRRRARRRRALRRRLFAGGALALVGVLAVAGVAYGPAPAAQAATTTFLITSAADTADHTLNGVCSVGTATGGACTLRAAIQEANAVGGTDPVVVTVDPTAIPSFTSITVTTGDCSPFMISGAGVAGYAKARFAVTRSHVTIDLKSRLGMSTPDCKNTAGLYIAAADVTVANVKDFFTGNGSFYVDGPSSNVRFTNISLAATKNHRPQAGIVITGAVNGVRITDSYFSNISKYSVVLGTGGTIQNVSITRSTFTNDTSSTTCNDGDGRGCRGDGILALGGTSTISGLTIAGNTFQSFTDITGQADSTPIDFSATGIAITDLAVEGNAFTGMATGTKVTDATITLPKDAALAGTNTIRGNRFENASANSTAQAIYWDGAQKAASNTVRSNLTIADNQISNYGTEKLPAVRLLQTGSVTVERNTFISTTAATDAGQEDGDANVLLDNNDTTSNRSIRPWRVSGTPSVTACTVSFTAQQGNLELISGGSEPSTPLRIDVYWSPSGEEGAEVFLGSQSGITGTSATVTVPYTINLTNGTLRLQVIGSPPVAGGQSESSQYSRQSGNVPAAPGCAPRVTVDQAAGQADPTSARDIRFTVRSSSPLATTSGDGQLVAADFATTGSTAPGVTVTDVTAVTPSLYRVTARANGSGTVVLSLPAGVVARVVTPTGSDPTNLASTSTDNSVTYTSPLERSPAALTVYEGAPGASIALTRSADVYPSDPITVAPTADNSWASVPAGVVLEPAATSGSILVTPGTGLAGQTYTTTVTATVSSADADYDGLILPAVTVTVAPAAILTPASGTSRGGTAVGIALNYLPAGATLTGVTFGTATVTPTGGGTAYTATSPAHTPYTGTATVNVTLTYTLPGPTTVTVVMPNAYTYVPYPAMTVTKAGFLDAAHTSPLPTGSAVAYGGTVYWTYTVTNTGDTPLQNVTVTDDKLGAVCSVPSIALGDAATCQASGAVQ